MKVSTPESRVENEVPPLEPGDHLTRPEFERRYENMPEVKKAELIEGVVYMPSPVRLGRHGVPHSKFITWLGTYQAFTPGVEICDNGTIRLEEDTEVQPDGFLYILPTHGGRARLAVDDYLEGGPELVGEIAASSVSFDLHTKLRIYERNGVQEYVVWRVAEQAVDWFLLKNGRFERVSAASDGVYRSRVFPGLWLDATALTLADMVRVLQVLQNGVASSEHAEFVRRLAAQAS